MGSLYTSHLIAGTDTLLKITSVNVKQIKNILCTTPIILLIEWKEFNWQETSSLHNNNCEVIMIKFLSNLIRY